MSTTSALPLSSPEPMSMGAVLRIGPLRRMWYAQVVSVFGDFLALYAVITTMTFHLHASATQVTGIQIAYMLPIAVLGILAGVFVDRWYVKPTLIASDLSRAALCLLLLFVHQPLGFYGALFSISIVSSFFNPAQGKALRSLVPMHGMRSAQALMQQVMFVMRIIGGPIAVLIVTAFGTRPCYILDALSFVASATLIASIPLVIPPASALQTTSQTTPAHADAAAAAARPDSMRNAQPAAPGVSGAEITGLARVLSDMKQGLSFIFHHAALLFVILALAAGMFVMGCFGPLIAVYVRDVLHAQGRTFSFTSAMIGVGLLAGINALNAFAKKAGNTVLVYSGLSSIAAGTLLLAALPHIGTACLGLLLIGVGAGGIIVPSQTMIQQETPQAMLGRVGSTVMSVIFTAQIVGLVLSGILTRHVSVRTVFGLCTMMLVVLTLAGKIWMEPELAPLGAETS